MIDPRPRPHDESGRIFDEEADVGETQAFDRALGEGGEALQAGDAAGARALLEKALRHKPRNQRARNLLGLTLFKLGELEKAESIYRGLIEDHPSDPTLRVNLGLVFLKSGASADAVRSFETAIDLQPAHLKAQNYLGVALAQKGDHARAREWFLKCGNAPMAERMQQAMQASPIQEVAEQAAETLDRAERPFRSALDGGPPAEADRPGEVPAPEQPAAVAEVAGEVEAEAAAAAAAAEATAPVAPAAGSEGAPAETDSVSLPPPVQGSRWVAVTPSLGTDPDLKPLGATIARIPVARSAGRDQLPAAVGAARDGAVLADAHAAAALVGLSLPPPVEGAEAVTQESARVALSADASPAPPAEEPAPPAAAPESPAPDPLTVTPAFAVPAPPASRVELASAPLAEEARHLAAAVPAPAPAADTAPYLKDTWPGGEQAEAAEAPAAARPGPSSRPLLPRAAGSRTPSSTPSALAAYTDSRRLEMPSGDEGFAIGPTEVVLRVSGELLTRLDGLVASFGNTQLHPELKRFRGKATDKPFGEGARRMLRAQGEGRLVISREGRCFTALELGDEPAYFREEILFAFDESLVFENGRVPSRGGADLHLVHLRGRGTLLLVTAGTPRSVEVLKGEPLRVPMDQLIGWHGPLIQPRLVPVVEEAPELGIALELSGEGRALVEAPEGR